MIDLKYIKDFYPESIRNNQQFEKHMLKEHVELLALDYICSQTEYVKKLVFIGGTNLRLVKNIGRFSEDIDFDCTGLTPDEFKSMTDKLVGNLRMQSSHHKNDAPYRKAVLLGASIHPAWLLTSKNG